MALPEEAWRLDYPGGLRLTFQVLTVPNVEAAPRDFSNDWVISYSTGTPRLDHTDKCGRCGSLVRVIYFEDSDSYYKYCPCRGRSGK